MNRKVIFVVGPTASGKTDLSISLAKRFNGEIISADSMQIYKGIHIASAAPDLKEREGIPHHLLEFLEPNADFSVADYVTKARRIINEIIVRKKIPIVVGGTGLYISALLDNTQFTDTKTDFNLRKQLETEFDAIGGEKMLEKLSEFDSVSAERLNKNDKRRIIRCFEIYKTGGITMTQQNECSHSQENDFESLILGINYVDREILYDRINRRVDLMIENGLIDEARKTFDSENFGGGFQAIGHKELYGFFRGDCSLEEAKELLKRQTRRYAKRQMTWFRRDSRINWIYADETDNITEKAINITEKFL